MTAEGSAPALVLVEDRRWRVGGCGRRCRFALCAGSAVARCNRGRTVKGDGRAFHKAPSWWHYCAEHLYGRVIVGDVVMVKVAEGSPAAERGWVE